MAKEKILLVEDDVNFGFVLKSYLEMNNYDITLVSDGKDAVKTFAENNFDLAVLDVMLPNTDGFTIAREIRRSDKTTPLIFLSAKSLKEDVLEGFNAGADDYLTKPFDSEVLLMKVKAILRRNKSIKPAVPPKVKIGKYEYQLESLDAWDIDHLSELQKDEKTKVSEFKDIFRTILYAIQKFNPDIEKMELEQFMKSFPVVGMQEKIKEINEVLGLNFTQELKKS